MPDAMEHSKAQVFDLFKKFDEGGHGTMQRTKLTKLLINLDPSVDAGDLNALLDTVDTRSDGRIPYEQFLGLVLELDTVNVQQLEIVYTLTDESALMATYSLLPILKAFTGRCGVQIRSPDISLSSRIMSAFPEMLSISKQVPDSLAGLGTLLSSGVANIIKLPNISASVPQLKNAISELQAHGLDVPCYPEVPVNAAEQEIQQRYKKILGSAVNPVLRQGNSDRRVAPPAKEHVKKDPHFMGAWSATSGTHVSSMNRGDFFGSEKTIVSEKAGRVTIELKTHDGQSISLKKDIAIQDGEILDASCMSKEQLREFYEQQLQDAQKKQVVCSLHLKASMMKVSDPIIFGHMVSVFFKELFDKHIDTFRCLGVNPNHGLSDLCKKIATLPQQESAQILADISEIYLKRPEIAMVDAQKGTTNLHVPSDVIIDASMPAMIRYSGKVYAPDGSMKDTKAIIPDRCYAGIFQETIDFCKAHGAFDPTSMGSVSNIGLMAQSAEEYGSHDKTFEITRSGIVRVVDDNGAELMQHSVEEGDIWRMCQTKDQPVRNWVKLAVEGARSSGTPAIFWLDRERPHEAALLKKVKMYLSEHNTDGLDIQIAPPHEACRLSLQRAKGGEDTISVTGNVLRDYLTDLFPILELGTSAKMLSIVPMLSGGCMYETGAGGTAPKLFRQLLDEGHLHWDSLGEFMAIATSLEALGVHEVRAKVMSSTLNSAIGRLLERGRGPSRCTRELDTRGSHFYLTLYWAEALSSQVDSPQLRDTFRPIAEQLSSKRSIIVEQIASVEGTPANVGGYYHPDPVKCNQVMSPSLVFSGIIQELANQTNDAI